MNTEQKIEAILFYKAEPVSIKKISETLDISTEEAETAIESLKNSLQERGIVLVQKESAVTLSTHPELVDVIEKLAHEEVSGPLTKATLETLAIVAYHGPITKVQIDYIRGVNSNFILRNLLVRGLIEKVPNPKDARTSLYKPSFELLAHLGIQSINELPEYDSFTDELKKIEAQEEVQKQTQEQGENHD